MKRLWIAIGIFAAIITLCAITQHHQQTQVKALLTALDEVTDAFERDDLDGALVLASALVQDFDRRTRLFPCFMSHSDIVGCRECVVLLPAILAEGNPEEFRMESARCRAQFERLLLVEIPNLQNIL